jgi:hypothetical protein
MNSKPTPESSGSRDEWHITDESERRLLIAFRAVTDEDARRHMLKVWEDLLHIQNAVVKDGKKKRKDKKRRKK